MNKFDVTVRLEKLRDQHRQWLDAQREYREAYDLILNRLLLEAARAYMSVSDIAHGISLSRKQVRDRMKALGLSQHDGKRIMADVAAKNLAENAALMGVDIDKFDLTSMLAYLPMGEKMKREMQPQGVKTLDDYVPTHYRIDFAMVAEFFQTLAERGGVVIPGAEDDDHVEVRLDFNEEDEPIIARDDLALVLGIEL